MGTTSRIDTIFAEAHAAHRPLLMPFLTGGYPSLDATQDALPKLQEAGASIVEVGIPFSDPIADGPVIASSMHAALQAGMTPAKIFKMVSDIRSRLDLGLIAMVSYSVVDRMSPEGFINDAAAAGFDGFIFPDIDITIAGEIRERCLQAGLSFSLLVSPTSTDERIQQLVDQCLGFVYVLARIGITGEQDERPTIEPLVQRIRRYTDLPLAVGFGISSAAHVAAVAAHAEAAIVGSALVRRMSDPDTAVDAAWRFTRELATGLRQPG